MASHVASNGSGAALDDVVKGQLAQLRQMQADLRSRPVTGSFRAIKKPFYKLVRSAFTRQFSLNKATIDLIETIYQQSGGHGETVPTNGAAPAHVQIVETGEVLASSGQVQDQAKLNGIRPLHGFNNVYTAPAELRMPERVAIYGLVFGLQPSNCLEIGTFRGGSTAIICGAMDDTGKGRMACVDPTPMVAPELWARLSHRCRMFQGPSPGILKEVAEANGEPFDFAFIDGDHPYECVRADIAGTLTVLADHAYVLFHDAHHPGVKRAIDEAVAKSKSLSDCGMISVEPTVLQENGQTVRWAGLRLLRFERAKV